MRFLHAATVLAVLGLLTWQVGAAETCVVDFGGPVLPAYLCAQQNAQDATRGAAWRASSPLASADWRYGGHAVFEGGGQCMP
jgi:hypothetical protein